MALRGPLPSDPPILRAWLGAARRDDDHVCLPEPLAFACRLDNALGPHDENISWRCYLHDWLLAVWYRMP